MPLLTAEDFALAEAAIRHGLAAMHQLYPAMGQFSVITENGRRLGPYLVEIGLLSVDELYELLISTPGLRPTEPATGFPSPPSITLTPPAGGDWLPQATVMPCPSCQTMIRLDASVCPACGYVLHQTATTENDRREMLVCPFCRFENEAGSLFCEQCKSELSEAARVYRTVDPDTDDPEVESAPGDLSRLDLSPARPGLESVVAGYRLIRLLGRGSSGEVYLGRHVHLQTQSAVKVSTDDRQAGRRFLREAQILARLSHRQVVAVINAGQQDGHYFLITQYLPGGDLRRWIEEHPLPPLGRLLEIAKDVALALAYLHRHGYVHRDVKPGNIFLDADGRALLGDFSVALAPRESQSDDPYRWGRVGTPPYLAPESGSGARPDVRTDLYGLGATLYHLLTGRPPSPEAGQDEPLPLESLRPDLPPTLQQILRRLLARRPEDRYQTPGELLLDLERLDPESAAATLVNPLAVTLVPEAQTQVGAESAEEEPALSGPCVEAEASGELTLVPSGTDNLEAHHTHVFGSSSPLDEAAQASRRWAELRGRNEDEAEAFLRDLPGPVLQGVALAAARQWQALRQAERLRRRALALWQNGQVSEAVRLASEAAQLAPEHEPCRQLLHKLEAEPELNPQTLKALAREGRLQGVPALVEALPRFVDAPDLANYLAGRDLFDFLNDRRSDGRARLLADLLSLRELRQLARDLGVLPLDVPDRGLLVRAVLEGIGFRP